MYCSFIKTGSVRDLRSEGALLCPHSGTSNMFLKGYPLEAKTAPKN